MAFDRALPGLAVQSVAADHLAGSQMIAEHMLSLGHRHFAVIGAPQHSPPVQARVQGATERLAEACLSAQMVLGPAHDCDACRALAVGILRNGSVANRPTAVIGTPDIAAIGAMHAALGMRLSVPADVSVIGFAACQNRALSYGLRPRWRSRCSRLACSWWRSWWRGSPGMWFNWWICRCVWWCAIRRQRRAKRLLAAI